MDKNTRILVTGASGKIGSPLFQALIQQYPYTIGISRTKTHNTNCYQIDITNQKSLTDFIKAHPVDIVVHTAAITQDFSSVPEAQLFQINLEGTRNILQALSTSIKKFIFLSSIDVYGNPCTDKITVSSALLGKSSYAKSKQLAESCVKESGYNFNILRLAPVYSETLTADLKKRIPGFGSLRFLFSPNEKRYTFASLDRVLSTINEAIQSPYSSTANVVDPIALSQNEILGICGIDRPKRILLPKDSLLCFFRLISLMLPGAKRNAAQESLRKLFNPPFILE